MLLFVHCLVQAELFSTSGPGRAPRADIELRRIPCDSLRAQRNKALIAQCALRYIVLKIHAERMCTA